MNVPCVLLTRWVLAWSVLITLLACIVACGEGSIDFHASTSKIQNTSADVLDSEDEITICAWVYPSGSAESGVVIALDEDGSGVRLEFEDSTLALIVDFGTNDGIWTVPLASNRWSAVVVKHQVSSTMSAPTISVDFVNLDPSPVSTPSGSAPEVNTGYCVGNTSDNSKPWEGRLAHVQVFNRLLSAGEMSASLRDPGSVTDELRLWLPMTNCVDTSDRSGNNFHATPTNVATGSNGPPIFTHPVGAPRGVAVLTPGNALVEQYVIPRYADGTNHPAGSLRGWGPASVIQGTVYGATNGTSPQNIVVTQDFGQDVKQWQNESGDYPAVLVPYIEGLTIAGRDVDDSGYVYHANNTSYNSPIPPNPGTAPQTPVAVIGDAGNEGVTFNNSTSKILNGSADVLDGEQTVTVCFWARARSWGESGYGHIITLDDEEDWNNNTAAFVVCHWPDNDTMAVIKRHGATGTTGHWIFPATDGHWNAVCIRYNFSDDGNDPTARVNKLSVTVTEVTAPPFGTPDDELPDDGYCIGNRSAGDLTWFGQIAHVQVWNRILSDAEADAALDNPGSVTTDLRLYLPMTSATDTDNEATVTGSGFDGTPTDLATHAGFYDRERGLGCTASGGRIMHTRFFGIAGQAAQINRPDGDTGGQILPFDEEMFKIDDLNIYRCYKGVQLNAVDTHVGSIECQYVRDYGVHFNTGGAYKIRGPIHVSGCFSGRPGYHAPCVWFGNEKWDPQNPTLYPHPGGSWGGPWYVETADIGMLIESNGNKLGPFYSHTCYHGNLRITGDRNSISNFEIDVVDGATEINGREGIYVSGQSCILLNGTIGGGGFGPVPSGEIAIRLANGTRQVIRDISFVGTINSPAPLISVAYPLNDSVIDARCFNGGTFLDLYRITNGTARGADTSTIVLDAKEHLGAVHLLVFGITTTITITGGTGADQTRTITAYDSETKTATVSSAWTTVPDDTSTYVIEANRLGSRNHI